MSGRQGSIRPRGKDTWEIRITLGYDAKGNAKRKSYTVKGQKKDAQKELTRLLREIDTGRYVAPSKLTVGQYLAQWLPQHAVTEQWAATTAEEVKAKMRVQLLPRLGDVPLEKLTVARLDAFVAECLARGRCGPDHRSKDSREQGPARLERGLGPSSVRRLLSILSVALNSAVRQGLIAQNPCTAVRRPKGSTFRGKALEKAEVRPLLELAAAEGGLIALLVPLGLGTGMRRGEMAALGWEDVDLEAGAVRVHRSLSETREGGLQFKGTKTHQEGWVTLPEWAVTALVRHRGRQAQEKLAASGSYQDKGLVFAEPDGSPVKPSKLGDMFRRFLTRHEVAHLRLHDLRHSHGSLLRLAGRDLKSIQTRLRHGSIQTTANIYLHEFDEMDRDSAAALDNLVEWRSGTEGGLR